MTGFPLNKGRSLFKARQSSILLRSTDPRWSHGRPRFKGSGRRSSKRLCHCLQRLSQCVNTVNDTDTHLCSRLPVRTTGEQGHRGGERRPHLRHRKVVSVTVMLTCHLLNTFWIWVNEPTCRQNSISHLLAAGMQAWDGTLRTEHR